MSSFPPIELFLSTKYWKEERAFKAHLHPSHELLMQRLIFIALSGLGEGFCDVIGT